MYDNTQYPNVDLQKLGLVRSGIVEETRTETDQIAAGVLPDRASFQQAVAARARVPGPVVLDYEDVYLRGSATTASRHLRVLMTLLQWAHAAAPGKSIGFFGLIDHLELRHLTLARRLAQREDAFFPSAYATPGPRSRWEARLRRSLSLAHMVAPRKPVYPYLWPQYEIRGTSTAGPFLDPSYWAFQLAATRRYADGIVIWSKRQRSTGSGWVGVTASFMRKLRS